MASTDSELTYHNSEAEKITARLVRLQDEVVAITGRPSIQSVHAAYGGKHASFIDIKNAVINTPQEFLALWLEGFMKQLGEASSSSVLIENFRLMQRHEVVQKYVFDFIERTYHRNFRSLNKVRPKDEEAYYWIGQERANYGLFVTPRFRNGNWENDRSEIRHFRSRYWSIGHVLETGLAVPFREDIMRFDDVEKYLAFFTNVLVRQSGSPHEMSIADRYSAFVRQANDPLDVPLLIPEVRYGGIDRQHEYRLDFCVVRQEISQKVGFELSPWSTHGYLKGLRGLTQEQINNLALGNFEKEMNKVKSYFRKYGIVVMIFTDSNLTDPDATFLEISRFLNPQPVSTQLKLSVIEDFKKFII